MTKLPHKGPSKPAQVQPQPRPGPCLPDDCPPPTEIACIETNYIYDSCFISVQREMSGDLPEIEDGLDPAVPYTTDVTVSGLTCDEVGRAPVGDADNSVYNVTLRVQYSCDVTIEQNGTVYYQGTLADTFFRTLCLCAPAGSTIDCARYSTVEGQAFVAAFEEEPAQASVQVNAGICLVTQSFATVQLLVPSYGFCVPGACPDVQTGIPCPPEMFPSGCGNAGSGS